MVAQNMVRTYGVYLVFRYVKAFGYSERVVKSEIFCRKILIFLHTCATCSEIPSYINTMRIGIELDKTASDIAGC